MDEGCEVLPSFQENEGLWAAATTDPWGDTEPEGAQEQINECPWQNPTPLDFRSHGRRELSYAARDGHLKFTQQLMENGAELEIKDDFGRTPLSWAAKGGHEAVVKLLEEKGATRF